MKKQNHIFNRVAVAREKSNTAKLSARFKRNTRRIALCIPILASMISIGVILKNSSAITLQGNPSNFQANADNLFISNDGSSVSLLNLVNGNGKTYDFYDITSDLTPTYNLASYISFPIENQEEDNTCAFFSANRATESSYIMDVARNGSDYTEMFSTAASGNTLNLSERYLDYLSSENIRGDRTAGSGTTTLNTAFTALELYGTPTEENFTYNTVYNADTIKSAPLAMRVRSVISFPNISAVTDETTRNAWLNVIKYMISHVSAVATDMVAPMDEATRLAKKANNPDLNLISANYNPETNAYYYNTTMGTDFGGHGVTLVGWDDTYDRSNFVTQPSTDGAFIALNSWGSDWGDGGYFYISYDSVSFLQNAHAVISTERLGTDSTYQVHTDESVYELDTDGSGDSYNEVNGKNTDRAGGNSILSSSSEVTNLTKNFFGYSAKHTDNPASPYPEAPNTPFLYQIAIGLGSNFRNEFLAVYINTTDDTFDVEKFSPLATIPLEISQTSYRLPEPIPLGEKFALAFEYIGPLDHSRVSPYYTGGDTRDAYLYNGTNSIKIADTLDALTSSTTSVSIPIYAFFQTGTYIGDYDPSTDPETPDEPDNPTPAPTPDDSKPATEPANDSTPEPTNAGSADTTEDKKSAEAEKSISAPDTGANDAWMNAETSSSDSYFLPVTVIVIFGSALAYDLIRKH